MAGGGRGRFTRLIINALRLRCPACMRGRLYLSLFRMRDRCGVCGLRLEREEGYFMGAIFLGYGATILTALLLFAVGFFYLRWPADRVIGIAIASTAVVPVLVWRWARALWLGLDHYVDPRPSPDGERGR